MCVYVHMCPCVVCVCVCVHILIASLLASPNAVMQNSMEPFYIIDLGMRLDISAINWNKTLIECPEVHCTSGVMGCACTCTPLPKRSTAAKYYI